MLGLQKCDSCNTSFKYSEIFQAIWLGYKPIQCEKCSSIHKITIPSRFIVVCLTILPMLIFGFSLSPPFSNFFLTLMIMLIIPFVGSLLTPFLVRYKRKNR
ncbi:TIGR04104 family putative zinc finger protein [Virgibacillus necropolis]|uniref:TIGR04104 family putative zinc finger protein n=1 Tax=Virgibacillus necropolis TaxID=163877 RepID=UPI00386F4386